MTTYASFRFSFLPIKSLPPYVSLSLHSRRPKMRFLARILLPALLCSCFALALTRSAVGFSFGDVPPSDAENMTAEQAHKQAMVHAMANDARAAVPYFRVAAERAPHVPSFRNNLGVALMRSGNFPHALDAFLTVLRYARSPSKTIPLLCILC